jgi:tRNA(fMet)-specific endonuclease VapC
MAFALDTDTCSAYMKRPNDLTHRFIQYSGRLAMPSVVLAELRAGAYRRSDPVPLLRKIDDLLIDVGVLDFDAACADAYGRVLGQMSRLGATVAPLDLMIASVALVHDRTLVTHNTSHFARVPGLRLADWLLP